jgi:hypothetical protein
VADVVLVDVVLFVDVVLADVVLVELVLPLSPPAPPALFELLVVEVEPPPALLWEPPSGPGGVSTLVPPQPAARSPTIRASPGNERTVTGFIIFRNEGSSRSARPKGRPGGDSRPSGDPPRDPGLDPEAR